MTTTQCEATNPLSEGDVVAAWTRCQDIADELGFDLRLECGVFVLNTFDDPSCIATQYKTKRINSLLEVLKKSGIGVPQ